MAAKIDFAKLTEDELKALIASAEQELDGRKQAVKQDAIDKIRAIADQAGLSLKDLAGAKKARMAPVAKYRNPNDPSKTWSGRGKKPRWMNEALEAGKSLADLEA